MKSTRTKRAARLMLRLRYGSYIDEACKLESILAKKPRQLRIDMAGSGEIRPDSALLMRSILLGRSRRTQVTTNARSSLEGATVLIWLLGDHRLIREDARLHFRPAGPFETEENSRATWNDWNIHGNYDMDEEDYIRVLQSINEFLPVRELAGKPIDVPQLKQFGLVDNDKTDRMLASFFRSESQASRRSRPKDASLKKPDVSI